MLSLSLPPLTILSTLFLTVPSHLDPPLMGQALSCPSCVDIYCLLDKASTQGGGLTEHYSVRVLSHGALALGTVVDPCFMRRTQTPRGKEDQETGLGLGKKGIWARSSCLGGIYAIRVRNLRN